MANILINKITSITINIGLINLAPFLSAILDPKIFPAMPNTAAGRPIYHNILPYICHNTAITYLYTSLYNTYIYPVTSLL